MAITASLAASFEDAATDSGTYVPDESARADWEAFGPNAFRYGTAAEALKSGAASGQSGQAVTAQNDGRLSADEKEKKERDKAVNSQIQQALLDQIERLNKDLAWLDDQIAKLNGEITKIDTEIEFLRQFKDEDDVVSENGKLKDEVADYVRSKGGKPEQMSPAEIILFMQEQEADLHNERDDKIEKRNGFEERRQDRIDELKDLEERAGLERGSTYEPALHQASDEAARSAQFSEITDLAEAAGQEAEQRVRQEATAPVSQGFNPSSGLG